VSHGVRAGRAIVSISYGKEKPIDTGTGEDAWQHNRNGHTAITAGRELRLVGLGWPAFAAFFDVRGGDGRSHDHQGPLRVSSAGRAQSLLALAFGARPGRRGPCRERSPRIPVEKRFQNVEKQVRQLREIILQAKGHRPAGAGAGQQ